MTDLTKLDENWDKKVFYFQHEVFLCRHLEA